MQLWWASDCNRGDPRLLIGVEGAEAWVSANALVAWRSFPGLQ
jgi:hypothetical protein